MTEQSAKGLAETIGGETVRLMPSTREWGVALESPNGQLAMIEDHAGCVYQDRAAFNAWQAQGDDSGVVRAAEWGEWGGGYEWACGLASVLGTERYWHSGGGIWLVFFDRTDGRFAVVGGESGGVYASYEEFDADLYGEKAENHHFV